MKIQLSSVKSSGLHSFGIKMKKEFSNANEKKIAEFYKKVSQNVRNLRESKEISQLDLALEIGIKSVAFYSNCESTRYGKHFNLEHIYKIAKALNVKMSDILDIE